MLDIVIIYCLLSLTYYIIVPSFYHSLGRLLTTLSLRAQIQVQRFCMSMSTLIVSWSLGSYSPFFSYH